ncbi:MAG: hypothetical protein CVV42_14320 [Candidatus Riflebacteria bacterium HGW-Riflebacteria-2]|nr:MAG: hypothetical protein CVV42_14320 [Candidatus Riflebacteria bacterium HGW-Riflebacteria-2]
MSRQPCQDKSVFIAKLGFAIWLCTLVIAVSAADIDWKKLEEKAKDYQNKQSGGKNIVVGGKSVNITIPSQPTGRNIDSSELILSESDQRYISVHMKLANRHFSRKNYTRAIEEVELVFERQPDHPGGRFMRAVIAARLKDHVTAWHNITIARDKDPESAKIKSFVEKLKTVAPEPQKTVGVPGIFRPIPLSASEKAMDVIEKLLKDQSSHNITSIDVDEYKIEGNSVWVQMKIACSSIVQKANIAAVLEKASGGKTEILSGPPPQGEEKLLEIKFEIPDMAVENKDVKPASDLREFVKLIAEETDVAISDSEERDAENKVLETIYEVASRDFKALNDFLRKMSPYALKFKLISMKLAFLAGSQDLIWRCRVQVFYQMS